MIQQKTNKLNLTNSKLFKSIRYFYTALGLVGGAGLGFLSLGFLGLSIGLSIGAIMSIVLHKTFAYLETK